MMLMGAVTLGPSTTAVFIIINKKRIKILQKAFLEKMSKHSELKKEVFQLWSTEAVKIVPIIPSDTGLIYKLLQALLYTMELVGVDKIINQMRKSAILYTSNIEIC